MTTSGVTAFSMTARELTKQAMLELGVLSSGEDPNTDEEADAIVRLNSMLKSWQTQGVNLWRQAESTVTTTADTATITLSAGIRNVFSARHVTDSYERLLGRFERDEYLSLPNKDTTGNPSIFYAQRGLSGVTLYLWPVPSTAESIKIDHERIVETVTNASQTVDVPESHLETVWVCLAERLIPMFGVAPDRAALVRERAAQLYSTMLDDDRPASIFMGPA